MPAPETPAAETERVSAAEWVTSRGALIEWLHAQAGAARWRVSREHFARALARSAAYRFGSASPTAEKIERYLRGLHLEDLALACALAEGSDAAWEHFVSTFRGVLYSAASAITGHSGAAAHELADSLYAELYGVDARGGKRASLFRYYHGRSKLGTWLRAVLAQRHVDAVRAARRLESLEDPGAHEHGFAVDRGPVAAAADPDRERYLARLSEALNCALAGLDERDRSRLSLYYVEGRTLAQIGKQLGEHEATASRQLERIRRELRTRVEAILRAGKPAVDGSGGQPGLSDAQMELCFEYALEDWPFDLREALGTRGAPMPKAQEGPS